MNSFLYLYFMERSQKIVMYELENKVKYLQKIIDELENELHKIKCCSKIVKKPMNSKKMELLSALSELKQKVKKTEKDKNNIYLIEMILKNMK